MSVVSNKRPQTNYKKTGNRTYPPQYAANNKDERSYTYATGQEQQYQ